MYILSPRSSALVKISILSFRSTRKVIVLLRVLYNHHHRTLPIFLIFLSHWRRTLRNMDVLLGKVTSQAMNYAIRSGLGLTAGYALRSANKLLSNAPKSTVRDELFTLQQRLQHKISIISPAIDMIELIAARGNTSLESAISLTQELRRDIVSVGQRLARAAATEEKSARASKISNLVKAENEQEMRLIVVDIKKLLERIEDAVPLINLAITTSGVRLSPSLPTTVSPSRLLQASTFLTAGDSQYAMTPRQAVQIGPTFTLTVYMLFAGHDRPQNEEDIRETTWKEVIHKARVKLRRVPLDLVAGTGSGSTAMPSTEIKSDSSDPIQADIPAESRANEFAYQLMIVEDFDDDRMHDFEEDQPQPGPFDDVMLAGIREMIPIHEVSKIFYADTSKVLNIGRDSENNHPVLLLKRDLNAVLPRGMAERADSAAQPNSHSNRTQKAQEHVNTDHTTHRIDPWRLPASLDPEWIAFEVYSEDSEYDSASDTDPVTDNSALKPSPSLEASIANLNLNTSTPSPSPAPQPSSTALATTTTTTAPTAPPPPWVNTIRTTLSLLELLLRLTSLQQFQQLSHLSITDELLNFFLEESATTGAGGDESQRQAVRRDARRRVGWDPYDESPVKRRGELYQYQDQDRYQYQDEGEGEGEEYDHQQWQSGGRGWSGSPVGSVVQRRLSPGIYGNGTSSPGMHGNGGWSPSPGPQPQTRSITRMSESQSQSPSPSPIVAVAQHNGNMKGSRPEWLKRQGQGQSMNARNLKGSPPRPRPRPRTGRSDEGLGTSPAAGVDGGGDSSVMPSIEDGVGSGDGEGE